MQVYLALVRRELEGYFVSLTGYVIITIMLLLLGFSFMDVLVKLNAQPSDAPVTEMFYNTFYFWLILLLTAPVITMRLFSLEKFSGTYETLMTTPVKDVEVVLAKFTGALVFYGLAWFPLLIYSWIVHQYSNDPGALEFRVLASTFLGILLIGSLYMSLGCFASALTRSQMVAAMVSYGLGIALFVLSLRALTAAPLPGWPAKVFSYISMTEHMEQFARGVVDTRPLIYYCTMTVFFLFLTVKVVESRRWN
jgi:ABC-2 type transport system permease protein